MVRGWCILQSKRNHLVVVATAWYDECGFYMVFFSYRNLEIPWISITYTTCLIFCYSVQYVINKWQWIVISLGHCIQWFVINTYPPTPMCLGIISTGFPQFECSTRYINLAFNNLFNSSLSTGKSSLCMLLSFWKTSLLPSSLLYASAHTWKLRSPYMKW